MANKYQAMAADEAALAAALKNAKDMGEYKRIQAVYLRVRRAMDVKEIAAITGFSADYVKHIHGTYRRHGLAGLLAKKKGGRYQEYLRIEEEKALLASREPEARRGGILEVSKVHRALQEKVGGKVALVTTYRLLHRHGWRKIAPRPRHPKADKEAQEAFKKTGL